MFKYSATDPRSFAIPVAVSSFIILSIFAVLTTQWVDTTEKIVRVPKHISAKLVHIDKPKPKTAKKAVKKPAQKKVKKQPAKKAKPVKKVIPKKAEKAVKKEQPKKETKPLPLPGSDLSAALAEEEQQMSMQDLLEAEISAQQAEKDSAAITSVSAQIKHLIQSVWQIPPSAKHTDEVLIRISLVPTGEVTDVHIIKSSGNSALDRSAELAVWKVAKLPVPDDLALFEKEFRNFNLNLRPENARL
jgi:colicin import membrane protein